MIDQTTGEYYHLAPLEEARFAVGRTVEFGGVENRHFESLMKRSFGVSALNGQHHYSILDVANDMVASNLGAPSQIREKLNYHFDPWRSLAEVCGVLEHNIRCLREIILETVRKESFAHIPSRCRCIWLIPDAPKVLDQWKTEYRNSGRKFRVFRVEATGQMHLGDNSLLVPQTVSKTQWMQIASRYWQGEIVNPLRVEVVFSGRITVLDEVK